MIVSDRPDGYRIVTQTEHGDLAGRFAEHWGRRPFTDPDPATPTSIAAYLHDNGWWEWDLRPHLGPDGRPMSVLDAPREDWTRFYERGIDNAVETHPYAGLLVSMHGSGVRRQRYGTHTAIPDYTDEFAGFIAREEERQRTLLAELETSPVYSGLVADEDRDMLGTLHETGTVGDPSTPLWDNYALLQAWDRLSLSLCGSDTLGGETLHPVPADGEPMAIEIESGAGSEVTLDPYPFDADPLTVSVRGRAVPTDGYETETDLIEAYYDADRESYEVTLRP